jgi:hypothetical protein
MNKTEKDAVRKEMTMDEIKALPNMLGRIASAMCHAHGEYKCVIGDVKTHIVLV